MMETGGIEYSDDFVSAEIDTSFWNLKRIREDRFEMVHDVDGTAGPALKVTVHQGDLPEIGGDGNGTERSELSERKEVILPAGTDVWYAFSVYIPKDFVVINNRLLFASWKQVGNRRPALALRYKNGNVIFIIQSKEERLTFKAPPIELGSWQRFMVHYRIAANHQGRTEAFLNGTSFASFEGFIGHPDDAVEAYFKLGAYRDTVPHTDTLYFAHFRRGSTRAFCEKHVDVFS